MIEFDELWKAGPRLARAESGFRLSTDSVLLAYFVNTPKPSRIIDLGSGTGVLTVLLAEKYPGAHITGIEIQQGSAELSRLSLRENSFDENCEVLCADLRKHRSLLPAGKFDLVVSNPPYFPAKGGYSAPEKQRRIAREEVCCTLTDICRAAAYLCRWGGTFAMVHRPERLSEICCMATAEGLEPKRLRFVQYKARSVPSLVLMAFRRGANPGLMLEPPLILANEDGNDTEEVIRIYHREAAK